MLNVITLPPDIKDRHAAIDLLRKTRSRFAFFECIYADGGNAGGDTAEAVRSTGCWKIEAVNRSDVNIFVVLPKRWIFERTFAWINRHRRLMREFERYTGTAAPFRRLPMIRLMLKRLRDELFIDESNLYGCALRVRVAFD